jgi:hypothetical protein
MTKNALALSILLLIASPSIGHHSEAGMDMTTVVALEGTVTEFRWRNPHVYVTLNSANKNGDEIEWKLQAGAVSIMSRMGWTRDSLSVGDHINVEAHKAQDGRPYGVLAVVVKANGTVLPTSLDAITGEPVQARAAPVQAATSLNGIWKVDSTNLKRYPGGSEGYFDANLKLTEKAVTAQSVYDANSAQNPFAQCLGVAQPYLTVLATIFPLGIEIDEEQNTVTIRSGAGDFRQTVHMDGRGHPKSGERTPEGHAIGWWEEDTLLIDTVSFDDHIDAYQIGVPSGAQKHLVQRFRLIEGGTRIEAEFFLEDPEYIVGSLSGKREMIYSPHMKIDPWDCDLESATQFLK